MPQANECLHISPATHMSMAQFQPPHTCELPSSNRTPPSLFSSSDYRTPAGSNAATRDAARSLRLVGAPFWEIPKAASPQVPSQTPQQSPRCCGERGVSCLLRPVDWNQGTSADASHGGRDSPSESQNIIKHPHREHRDSHPPTRPFEPGSPSGQASQGTEFTDLQGGAQRESRRAGEARVVRMSGHW